MNSAFKISTFLILVLAFPGQIFSKTLLCDSLELAIYKDQLKMTGRTLPSTKAVALADSILPPLSNVQLQDCPETFWIYFYKGEALEQLMDFEDALILYHTLLKSLKKLERPDFTAHTLISAARVHEAIQRPMDCRRYLDEALAIIKNIESNEAILSRYAIRNSSYHRLYADVDSALMFARQGVSLGTKTQVMRSMIDGHLLLGILDTPSYFYHVNRAMDLYLAQGEYIGAMFQIGHLANKSEKKKDWEKMNQYALQGLSYLDSIEYNKLSYYIISILYRHRSTYFEKKNILDSANHFLKLSFDSKILAERQLSDRVINEKEIDFALQVEQSKTLEQKRRVRTLWLGLSMLALLAIVLAFLFLKINRNQKLIKNQNEIIAKKNAALEVSDNKNKTLLAEVHHRIKNNLQLLISIMTLQGMKLKNRELALPLEEISAKIRSIALIHELLYTSESFDVIDLDEYFSKLGEFYINLTNLDQKISYGIHCNSISLNMDTLIPLGIIFSELLNNSLKYARTSHRALTLQLEIKKDGEGYQMLFNDNGPGYSEEFFDKKSNSMGMTLILSMVRQLKAAHSFYNESGAAFKLLFSKKVSSKI